MPRKIAVNLAFLGLLLLSALGTGCATLSLPRLPHPIAMPAAEVAGVRRIEQGPAASRYQILVTLTNPNAFPLPVSGSDYKLTVAGNSYRGDTPPSATIPASGAITITLPAAVPGALGEYSLTGHIQVHPPGQVKPVLYDLGVPLPRVPFESKGVVEDVKTPQTK